MSKSAKIRWVFIVPALTKPIIVIINIIDATGAT